MSDRLEEIKGRYEYVTTHSGDVEWLIAEVERLRFKESALVASVDIIKNAYKGQFVALRGALQALVDATGDPAHDWNKIDSARAVTVAVLTEELSRQCFDAIAHGDENHRQWLRQTLDEFFESVM